MLGNELVVHCGRPT